MSGKLKGIYEALDHGNFKNAIKQCSAFLQKQPTHALCRVLQAVAYERSGRRDEAIQLCDEIVSSAGAATAGSPAYLDETCLGTLQVVFRRCQRYQSITQMYEAAWTREPDSEEFALSLFFGALREDPAKAQQVALKIYRKFNKPHFLNWVIITILLHVRAGGPTISLDLAARMLEKAPINTDIFRTEEPLLFNKGQFGLFVLHLNVLRMQKKHAQALELLEACKWLCKLPTDFAALRVQLLCEADQTLDAIAEARRKVINNPGNGAAVQEYARLVFEAPPPESFDASRKAYSRLCTSSSLPKASDLATLEQQMTEDEVLNALLVFRYFQQTEETNTLGGISNGLNRIAFLGEFELWRTALIMSASSSPFSVEKDLPDLFATMRNFIKRYSSKSHCFFDLKPILSVVLVSDAEQILTATSSQNEDIEALLFNARLRRALIGKEASRKSAESEACEASALLDLWLAQGSSGLGRAKPALETLLQLAAVAFFEMDRICCLEKKEFDRRHLIDAIALCELGLATSPHAFTFKVLLLLAHLALGLPALMMTIYNTMDIKNVQHESLSYILLDLVSTSNTENARDFLRAVVQFHEDLDKDTGEALQTAFNIGSLQRLPEYMSSIAQVNHSLMWGKAIIEEVQSELSAATSWELFAEAANRQASALSFISQKDNEQWASRNQDRALLNGLQPLQSPLPTSVMTESTSRLKFHQQPRALTSMAIAWTEEPSSRSTVRLQRGQLGAADELLSLGLEGSPGTQVRLSAALLEISALIAGRASPTEEVLSQLLARAKTLLQNLPGSFFFTDGETISKAASCLLKEDSAGGAAAAWTQAAWEFRVICWSFSFAVCEVSEIMLRCISGSEVWERLSHRLDGLAVGVNGLACLFRDQASSESFQPPTRNTSSIRPFTIGSFGVPWLWTFLTVCISSLIPVALWCSNTLPKAGPGKKIKEGQEALLASRHSLKNLLQVIQTSLSDLQSGITGIISSQSSALLPSQSEGAQLEVQALARMPEHFKHLREEATASILDGQKKQLKMLHAAISNRSALLKSRGAFKI